MINTLEISSEVRGNVHSAAWLLLAGLLFFSPFFSIFFLSCLEISIQPSPVRILSKHQISSSHSPLQPYIDFCIIYRAILPLRAPSAANSQMVDMSRESSPAPSLQDCIIVKHLPPTALCTNRDAGHNKARESTECESSSEYVPSDTDSDVDDDEANMALDGREGARTLKVRFNLSPEKPSSTRNQVSRPPTVPRRSGILAYHVHQASLFLHYLTCFMTFLPSPPPVKSVPLQHHL